MWSLGGNFEHRRTPELSSSDARGWQACGSFPLPPQDEERNPFLLIRLAKDSPAQTGKEIIPRAASGMPNFCRGTSDSYTENGADDRSVPGASCRHSLRPGPPARPLILSHLGTGRPTDTQSSVRGGGSPRSLIITARPWKWRPNRRCKYTLKESSFCENINEALPSRTRRSREGDSMRGQWPCCQGVTAEKCRLPVASQAPGLWFRLCSWHTGSFHLASATARQHEGGDPAFLLPSSWRARN